MDVKNLGSLFKNPKVQKIGMFFRRKWVKISVFLVGALLFVYCVNLWYDCIYSPSWSESRKSEYIKNKDSGTAFNAMGFEKVVGENALRKNESQKMLDNMEDIFRVGK